VNHKEVYGEEVNSIALTRNSFGEPCDSVTSELVQVL
jgi:hypothetical protein